MNISVCSSSVDVVREWICLSSFFSLSVSSCTFHPRCSLTTSSWWELQGCYDGWDILLLYTRLLLFVLPYIHTHTTHSYTIHFIISLSHRDQDKPPSYTKVHVGRMNNGYAAWTPAELQLCQMEIYSKPEHPLYISCTVLMWPFIHPFCVAVTALGAADRLTHSNKVCFVQPRGLCGRVRLMRLDKPSTLTWDLGERCLGLMCNALDAAGLRVLRLRPVKPVFRYIIFANKY